jgi:glycosyltransferase involved in cell wall biosynthesis
MRVLQLTQYLALGGLERCVTNLAVGLALRGNQSSVAVYEESGLCTAFCDELTARGVQVYSWQKRSGFSPETLWHLLKIVRSRKIDIIHSHDLGALIYAVILSFLLLGRIRVVHTQHSFVHFRKKKSRYVLYERFFPRFANVVCGVSRRVEQTYRHLGIPNEKLAIVSNGVAFPEQFSQPGSARKALSEKYPLKLDFLSEEQTMQPRLLLFMGRIVPGKGIDRLLKAWQGLPEPTKEHWRVLLVGPINDKQYFHELNSMLHGSRHSPAFLGASDEPYLFYQASDAFVSLSEEEGMPLAAYEAIGCGLPALLSDIPGHRELNSWAHLLPSSSSTSDTQRLQEFLEETRECSNKSTNWTQMETFRRQFSFEGMVKNYLEKYKCILMTLAVLLLSHFTIMQSNADATQVQLTTLLERPEYLLSTDWQSEISLKLSRGEKTLLTLKTNKWCGHLPVLSENLKAVGLQLRWYGGVGIPVKKPSYEGALLGKYVDALVPISSETTPCQGDGRNSFDWLFAELTVESDATSGTFSGALLNRLHRSQNGESLADMANPHWALKVDILPLEMPEVWSLPMRAEFTPFFASLAHYGRSGREEGELTLRYVRAMFEHRILPLKAWIKHPFQTVAERQAENFLLSRFPSQELSFSSTVLPSLPPWVRIDLPRIDSASSEDRRAYWNRWHNYLESESNDTLESALIQRLKNQPIVYLWDEPTQEQFTSLHEVASDVQVSAPSVSSLVTVYPWQSLQDAILIFAPLLQTLVREGKPSLFENRELWSYVSCMSHGCGSDYSSGEPDFVIERNSAYVRVWPWMADEYQLATVLYYSVNNVWRKAKSQDPWEDLYDFTGNGDGTLFYPGRPGMYGLKDHVPVPSLRMKFWQQSSFDAEYIRWADQFNPACFAKTKLENSLVKDGINWNRDPRKYQSARAALIECVVEGLLSNSRSD